MDAALSPSRSIGRASRALAVLGFAILAVPVLDLTTAQLRNCDIYWQVRTGDIALQTGSFPSTDPFSYTVAGTPWNNHEWAFKLFVALLHRFAGWGGVRVLAGIVPLAVLIGIAVVLWRRTGPTFAALGTTLSFLLMTYKFLPAPQTTSMALFLLAFYWSRSSALLASPPRALALIGLMLVWGNLTAEALLFLPFLVLDQGSHLWGARRALGARVFATQAGVLALACLAPLVNPPWSSTLDYALAGTGVNRQVNVEFRSFLDPAGTVTPAVKWLAIGIAIAYVAWAVRALVGTPTLARLRQVGPGLLAVIAAATMERNLWLLVIPVCRMCVEASALQPRHVADVVAVVLAPMLTVGWLAAKGWTPSAEHRYLSHEFWSEPIDRAQVPIDCAEYVSQLGSGKHVFTWRVWANYLVWAAPEDRVFIDGRNREYPPELFDAMAEVWRGGRSALKILDASGTDVVIATQSWAESAGVKGSPWRRTFAGRQCAVYRR